MLNLSNQYFAATPPPQLTDSKDRGKKDRGRGTPTRIASRSSDSASASRSPDAHTPAESPHAPAASGPGTRSGSGTARTPPRAHPAPPPAPPPAYSDPPARHRTSR